MKPCILFDVDGVLVSTVGLHFNTLNTALSHYNRPPISKADEEFYNGLPTRVKLAMLDTPEELVEPIHKLKQELTYEEIGKLPPDQSKVNLLSYLKKIGIRLAACSNAINKSVVAMLNSINCFSLFDVVLGTDSIVKPKPNPEIYLTAARELGCSISNCIIVEDSEIGLAAAYAAKPKRVVEVRGPHEVNMSLVERLI